MQPETRAPSEWGRELDAFEALVITAGEVDANRGMADRAVGKGIDESRRLAVVVDPVLERGSVDFRLNKQSSALRMVHRW